jgi:hypothetical protein
MWFCHLTEMTTMMLDINQLTESMEVDRLIWPYYMLIISIGQIRYGQLETLKIRYILTTNFI